MVEAMISGLLSIFELKALTVLLIGIPIGLIFGILPGLGGLTALAVLMPLIYGMNPGSALAFLLAAHAVIYTGGSVTAVLLNIPGAPPNAATLVDGFPMTQKGLAGRALGNALAASGVGGLAGGVVLVGLIFVVRPIVMAFGLPEYFFLVVLGISFIAVLGSGSAVKGLISGIIGIFLSFIGLPQQTMSQTSMQPQASSTVTASPHTSHAYESPLATFFFAAVTFFSAILPPPF